MAVLLTATGLRDLAAVVVRSMLAERINQWIERLLEQGRDQALVALRDLLIRLGRRRFGANCAERLGRLLTGIDDVALLTRIGIWCWSGMRRRIFCPAWRRCYPDPETLRVAPGLVR